MDPIILGWQNDRSRLLGSSATSERVRMYQQRRQKMNASSGGTCHLETRSRCHCAVYVLDRVSVSALPLRRQVEGNPFCQSTHHHRTTVARARAVLRHRIPPHEDPPQISISATSMGLSSKYVRPSLLMGRGDVLCGHSHPQYLLLSPSMPSPSMEDEEVGKGFNIVLISILVGFFVRHL
jgi:hypothetical protein